MLHFFGERLWGEAWVIWSLLWGRFESFGGVILGAWGVILGTLGVLGPLFCTFVKKHLHAPNRAARF